MAKQTPLHDAHIDLDAKMVDFAGWDMPVNYGSQIDEHKQVRSDAGMFDVSHMAAVDIYGPQAREFLRRLWANDVAKADKPGKALYTCMLNTSGGVIDDLIVYHINDKHYRTVLNAGTTDKDMAWIKSQARDFDVNIDHRQDLSIIAIQGPNARQKAGSALPEQQAQACARLKPFFAELIDDWLIGRTGYTGEDGVEIILPADAAEQTWQSLLDAGVKPCGLGARDTLRLEAGLNLYGQDMDEDSHPLESGLGWTVAWEPAERDFIGREVLEAERDNHDYCLVGLLLEGRGVMRAGQSLRHEKLEGEGRTTSGSYAPTLEKSIALARVPVAWENRVEVNIRDKWVPARIVSYPFVRNGQVKIEL